MKLRQRGILFLICVVGLCVLGGVIVGNLPALTEWWYIFRLGSSHAGTRDQAVRWLKENGSARAIPALIDHAAARPAEQESALSALETILPRGSAAQQADAAGKLLTVAREEVAGQSKTEGAAGLLIRLAPGLPATFPVLLDGARTGDPLLLSICACALCDAWPASRSQVDDALRDASPESALAFFKAPWTPSRVPPANGLRCVAAHLAREHPHPDVRAVGLAFALWTGLSQGRDSSRDTYDTDLLEECMAPSAPPALRRAAVRLSAYLGSLPNVPDLGSLLLAEPDGSPLLVDLIQARDHQSDKHYGIYGVDLLDDDLLDGVSCDWIPSRGPQVADWTDAELARLETILRTETDGRQRDAASAALASRYLPRWNPGPQTAPAFEVHEWGVWRDGGDLLSVAEATLAELPPFVHRTSASTVAVVEERGYNPSAVTKPVLFFHAAEPLNVFVRVWFFEGRPWTYFPDATDELETTRPRYYGRPALVDRTGISPPWPLSKVPARFFEIAPWLIPPHPLFASEDDDGPIELAGMGVEWRGLRVGSDAVLEPPPSAVDPSSWWNFLREVPASPVAVRGERESFLFYDGSTNVPAPVIPSWNGSGKKALRLFIRSWGEYPRAWSEYAARWEHWDERQESDRPPLAPIPYAFVFRKDGGAPPRGTVRRGLSPDADPEIVDLDALDLEGDRLVEMFGETLCSEGLTPEETRSLLRTWESDFFQKPGLRLVTFLPRWLYDLAVPLCIHPVPVRLVRVALVFREIDSLP